MQNLECQKFSDSNNNYTYFGKYLSESIANYSYKEDLTKLFFRTKKALENKPENSGCYLTEFKLIKLQACVYFNPGFYLIDRNEMNERKFEEERLGNSSDDSVYEMEEDISDYSEWETFYKFNQNDFEKYKEESKISIIYRTRKDISVLTEESKPVNKKLILLKELETGTFSKVFKAYDSKLKRNYAIKIIPLKGKSNEGENNKIRKEIYILKKCTSNFSINYIDSWINTTKNVLYIETELYDMNLQKALDYIRKYFNRKKYEPIKCLEYFICSHIFIELIECVEYLHSIGIIHRDIKPQNILIIKNPINEMFIKICDFGSSKIYNEIKTTSSDKNEFFGTITYMAPEIKNHKLRSYNFMSDIYSCGKVLSDIFDMDINFNSIEILHQKCNHLTSLYENMVNDIPEERPSCNKILSKTNEWSIVFDEFETFNIIPPEMVQDNIIHKILLTKIKVMKYKDQQFGEEYNINITKVKENEVHNPNSVIYSMIKKPRGKAIIINNIPSEVLLETQRYNFIFKELLFDVELCFQLNIIEILLKLEKISKEVYNKLTKSNGDEALIVMIISYGKDGQICGADHPFCSGIKENDDHYNLSINDICNIHEIVNIFNYLDLVKMFFFNCVEYNTSEDNKQMKRNFINFSSNYSIQNAFIYYINTKEKDNVVNYTTYGRILSESIAKFANKKDLIALINKTNERLKITNEIKDSSEEYAPGSRLEGSSKKLYFNPGYYHCPQKINED